MARPYPRLLHPVTVLLEQISPSDTVYDPDTREPIQQAARAASVSLRGQVKYGVSKEMRVEPAGIQENERGYVLFRQKDLTAASVSLAINDRISKIGRVNHDAYITRLEPTGHYGDLGGNTLVKAYFADRQPSKHRRAG